MTVLSAPFHLPERIPISFPIRNLLGGEFRLMGINGDLIGINSHPQFGGRLAHRRH